MKVAATITASVLAILVSPIVMRNMCGLTSWPLDWAVSLGVFVFPVVLLRWAKKTWQAWMIVVAAPVVSLMANLLLSELLHWEKCPRVLYDAAGKAWVDRMRQNDPQPNGRSIQP